MKNVFVLGAVLGFTLVSACSSNSRTKGSGSDLSHGNSDGGFTLDDGGNIITDDGGNVVGDGGGMTHDPTTCAEAATSKSYIGCDYWPTVTANAVWSVFDYAVVVSNPGTSMVNVTVSGGALSAPKTAMVAPGQLTYIALPWVPTLKGQDADSQGMPTPMTASVFAAKGAYHLVADAPVLVYQFNALEYKAGTGKDLNGTNWSTCPAAGFPCNSYSNDASLLLPSTAMTDNYVITGLSGDDLNGNPNNSSYAVITATADATTVIVQLSATADLIASSGNTKIPKTVKNKTSPAKVTFTLDAGDVLELLTSNGTAFDLTGSIVQATAPVQVIVGNPCTAAGDDTGTCDHVEETVLPVQTWGKQYVVTGPTGPNGNKPGHVVRIYGGIADSTLTLTPAVSGAPSIIKAGTVAKFTTSTDFVVSGTTEFVVSSEQQSGEIVDSSNFVDPQGDPSLSFMVAVPQFRDKYLFLAPTDYPTNFADVVMPDGTTLMLDGAAVTTGVAFVGGGFSVVRIPLPAGTKNGAHTLTGSAPFGIQIVGYGSQTSYQYPGGLDLKVISSAPPPIN
ncbi:MAG: IgGFc-binding protein [Polyangia bacterium]